MGLYAFWDDALFRGNDLRFHGTTGGENWWAGVLTDRLAVARVVGEVGPLVRVGAVVIEFLRAFVSGVA